MDYQEAVITGFAKGVESTIRMRTWAHVPADDIVWWITHQTEERPLQRGDYVLVRNSWLLFWYWHGERLEIAIPRVVWRNWPRDAHEDRL